MLFNDSFIEETKHNPIKSTLEICEKVLQIEPLFGENWGDNEHEAYLEGFALISAMIKAKLIYSALTPPAPIGSPAMDCPSIQDWLIKIRNVFQKKTALAKMESFEDKFKIAIGNSFHYEFSQGDLIRVQELINALRQEISISQLTDEHKQRLLRKLEKMQSELHKKVSDVDSFWGLVGDAGVALGKLGTDAKPIVDRIREIADIVWNTQSKAEELPSGTSPPMLENKSSQGKIEA